MADNTKQEGQRLAIERREDLRGIVYDARATVMSEEDIRAAREEEEIRRMLEGMAIRQTREREETECRFEERRKQLWTVRSILAQERNADILIGDRRRHRRGEPKGSSTSQCASSSQEEAGRGGCSGCSSRENGCSGAARS